MKGTQNIKGYNQLSLGLFYENSLVDKDIRGVYPISKEGISQTKKANRFVVHELLLETILEDANIEKVIARIVSNKNGKGVDEMQVAEVRTHFHQNWSYVKKLLMEGRYSPKAVKRVEIPKKLWIPTVPDRMIQRAIVQILTPIYEEQFSNNSYGFRPERNAQQAVRKVVEKANEGYCYAVDLDLEKYFDTVSHQRLMQIVSNTIKDGRVISLKHKYEETAQSVPQGGLCGNRHKKVY